MFVLVFDKMIRADNNSTKCITQRDGFFIVFFMSRLGEGIHHIIGKILTSETYHHY